MPNAAIPMINARMAEAGRRVFGAGFLLDSLVPRDFDITPTLP